MRLLPELSREVLHMHPRMSNGVLPKLCSADFHDRPDGVMSFAKWACLAYAYEIGLFRQCFHLSQRDAHHRVFDGREEIRVALALGLEWKTRARDMKAT